MFSRFGDLSLALFILQLGFCLWNVTHETINASSLLNYTRSSVRPHFSLLLLLLWPALHFSVCIRMSDANNEHPLNIVKAKVLCASWHGLRKIYNNIMSWIFYCHCVSQLSMYFKYVCDGVRTCKLLLFCIFLFAFKLFCLVFLSCILAWKTLTQSKWFSLYFNSIGTRRKPELIEQKNSKELIKIENQKTNGAQTLLYYA